VSLVTNNHHQNYPYIGFAFYVPINPSFCCPGQVDSVIIILYHPNFINFLTTTAKILFLVTSYLFNFITPHSFEPIICKRKT